MRKTLLKMTQDILSSMDSDEIDSIGDTTESLQVVDIIEQTYFDIASTIDFPDFWDFFELTPSIDITKPTLMSVPERIAKIEWVQYDNSEDGATSINYIEVRPMERKQFLDRMNKLDTADTDVYSFNYVNDNSETMEVRGKNNAFPVYYTALKDHTLLFDNFDNSVSQTLVGNKTRCYGMFIPEFTREDDFIPLLDPRQFTLLYNEAKAQCWTDLKQADNTKAEQRARRGWVQAHRKEPTVDPGKIHWDYTWNYGRHR